MDSPYEEMTEMQKDEVKCPKIYCYHCPGAPKPWVAVYHGTRKNKNGKVTFSPLPVNFYGKEELEVTVMAEEWWITEVAKYKRLDKRNHELVERRRQFLADKGEGEPVENNEFAEKVAEKVKATKKK
jgi:hypothetical protein